MKLVIVNLETGKVLNEYILPKKEDGTSYSLADITTAPDVSIVEADDDVKVGDVLP